MPINIQSPRLLAWQIWKKNIFSFQHTIINVNPRQSAMFSRNSLARLNISSHVLCMMKQKSAKIISQQSHAMFAPLGRQFVRHVNGESQSISNYLVRCLIFRQVFLEIREIFTVFSDVLWSIFCLQHLHLMIEILCQKFLLIRTCVFFGSHYLNF